MIITLIVAMLIISSLAFIAKNTFKRILGSPHKKKQLIVFWSCLVLGASIGTWMGFAFEYQLSNTLRITGFPFPLVAFHLENGQWVDFVMPIPLLNAIINLTIITLLVSVPLNLIFRFADRKHKNSELSASPNGVPFGRP